MRRKVDNEEFRIAYENKDNKKIMRKVINKYRGSLISSDELNSCALVGLWRALGYHDNSFKQKFTTTLWRFTNWECQRELAKKTRKKNKIIVQPIIDLDIPMPERSEECIKLQECLKLLPDNQRQIINEYYFDKRTMEEIGSIHSYSKESARQKIMMAICKLKEIYCEGV